MSFTLWFTGLSGSGKTTLSRLVHREVLRRAVSAELLDGDIVRANISQELGFTRPEREINLHRIGFIAHLLNRHGGVCIVAAIAPYQESRLRNRRLISNYIEVYCCCPLEVAEQRDVKGLYARARRGEIPHFTGISDPYDLPAAPELLLPTHELTIEQSVQRIMGYLVANGHVPADPVLSLDEVERSEEQYRQILQKTGCLR